MKLFNNLNLNRLKEGLSKTRNKLVSSISETVSGKAIIDDNTLIELEEALISSDINSELSEKIIENLRVTLKSEKDRTYDNILNQLKKELIKILEIGQTDLKENNKNELRKPFVILVIGVNGVGKTTTVGKLANNFRQAGNKVIIGSADTFRAAANEQLDIWAKRADVEVVQQKQGADPSSISFDTIKKAIKEDYDVVLIDTAGRLQSKTNLMNELNKIYKALDKALPGAPDETYLVLDATLGQNAVLQAEEFSKFAKLSGLVINKLDGTAKGGTIFKICYNQKIPIKYIGVGEKLEDLQNFNAASFVDAIF